MFGGSECSALQSGQQAHNNSIASEMISTDVEYSHLYSIQATVYTLQTVY